VHIDGIPLETEDEAVIEQPENGHFCKDDPSFYFDDIVGDNVCLRTFILVSVMLTLLVMISTMSHPVTIMEKLLEVAYLQIVEQCFFSSMATCYFSLKVNEIASKCSSFLSTVIF